MFNILNAIYHDDPLSPSILCNLDRPQTTEEQRTAVQLRTVDTDTAEALKESICALADEQAERAFYAGIRFGAQLMAQLMGEF